MIPGKLRNGDTILVVPASRSLSIVSQETREIAVSNLEKIWLKVIIGQNAELIDSVNSLPVKNRIDDIHRWFSDAHIKWLFTVIGWFNSIQLLSELDYQLIEQNPKILCWYSDVTVLLNAIYAKTWLITYYGPHFSTFWVKKWNEYTLEYAKKCLFEDAPFLVKSSEQWSDDLWYLNQDERTFYKNEWLVTLQEWETEWILVWWNINAFRLLNGTEYFPDLNEKILFLENDWLDKEYTYQEFDRRLESILLQNWWDNIRWLLIWRFKVISNMNIEKLKNIIEGKKRLRGIPIIYGLDFGHSLPMMTIPIGWRARLDVRDSGIKLTITQY